MIQDFDRRVTSVIRRLPDSLQPFMTGLTFLGEPLVVLSVGVAGYFSALNSSHDELAKVFIYAVIAYSLSTILKFILRRRRPNGVIVRTLGINSYSFPSGHAFGTMIFYGLIAYLDIKYLSVPWNYLFGLFIGFIILLIGISRIYLKVHYPSDIIGGWLIGISFLIGIVLLGF